MSRRVRMTLVFEFDYLVNKMGAEQADILVENFTNDPTAFIHPLEIDEELFVHIEDITEEK